MKHQVWKWMGISCLVGILVVSSAFCQAEEATKITLTLNQAIKFAIDNNLQRKLAAGEVELASDKVKQAQSGYFPKVTLSGGYQHFSETPDLVKLANSITDFNNGLDTWAEAVNMPVIAAENPYFDPSKPVSPTNPKYITKKPFEPLANNLNQKERLNQGLDYYGLKLSLEQPLYTGKKLTAINRQAQTNLKLAGTNLKVAEANLVYEVKKSYYTVLQTEKLVQTANEAVNSMKAHLAEANAYYKAGMVPKLDLLRAEVKLADLNQKLLMAENGLNMARTAFNFLLGVDLDTAYQLVDEAKVEIAVDDLASCKAKALTKRQELAVIDAKIELARQGIVLAKSNGKPMVALRFDGEQNETKIPFEGTPDWKVGLVGQMTLFDGGQIRNQIAEAEDLVKQAQTGRELVLRGIKLEVEQAYRNLQNYAKAIEVAEKSLSQAKEAVHMAEVSYKSGLNTSIERIDAEVGLTQAKENYAQAVSMYNVALAQLEKAMGIEVEELK